MCCVSNTIVCSGNASVFFFALKEAFKNELLCVFLSLWITRSWLQQQSRIDFAAKGLLSSTLATMEKSSCSAVGEQRPSAS